LTILLIDTVAGTSIVLLRYHRVIRQMYEIIMKVHRTPGGARWKIIKYY